LKRRGAFTLIELLVVVTIIALLISILQPSLGKAREVSRGAYCVSNLHQVGVATKSYVVTSKNLYPYGLTISPASVVWPPASDTRPTQELLLPFIGNSGKVWLCPTDPAPQNYNWWAYNTHPNYDKLNVKGSSYMFSEHAQYRPADMQAGQRVPGLTNDSAVYQPSTFGYTADGFLCPNGWTWDTLDPFDPGKAQPLDYWAQRVSWSHLDQVGMLFGDSHAALMQQRGIAAAARSDPFQ
jgi:prepilin-type N-terminal cleavage/methylation domain-containing protein